MAIQFADRVQVSATANTTISFTLGSALTGFQAFSVLTNGNTTYYAATDASGNWEVGLGTYASAGPTLTRTTILSSSNSGSAVTFSGSVNVFITYPSAKVVILDASGNATALGTISSGTWQGTTVAVAYGGTGVTASSGANSVMLRDANQNVSINRLNQGSNTVTAAAGTTVLTAASAFSQILNGTGGQTYRLPDATTLTTTTAFQFNNNATGTLTIVDNASGAVGTIASGGAADIALLSNGTVAGTWDVHAYIPENVQWGTNSLALGSTVITGGTWNGGTITSGYGGTGLTTFTAANNALYSTSAGALAAGTLPVAAGGTGVATTPTNGQLLIGNGTTYTVASLGTSTGISTTTGSGTLTINNTGVTSNVAGTGISLSGTTGAVTITNSGVTSFSAGTTGLTPSTGTTGSVTLAGTLVVGNGGTGVSAYTAGDMLYFASGTALSKLAIGSANYVLTSTGSAPQYVAQSTLSVGSATSATTATNLAGGAASQIPYQTGSGATSFIANGTSGQVLTSNGSSAPSWQNISAATKSYAQAMRILAL